MRAIYRIPLLAVSSFILSKSNGFFHINQNLFFFLVKCLQKLEQLNENARSPPCIPITEQPASRPPRFVKSAINKQDDR